jgi:tetratricopeptide (TPR) repeat protein
MRRFLLLIFLLVFFKVCVFSLDYGSSFERDKRNKQTEITNLYARGIGLYNNGNYEEAFKIWQAILVLDYKNSSAKEYLEKTRKKISQKASLLHITRGRELLEAGKAMQALTEFQMALDKSPLDAEVKEAVRDIKSRIAREHKNKYEEYFKNNKLLEAAGELNAILAINPDNPIAKKNLVVIDQKLNNLKKEERRNYEYENIILRADTAYKRNDLNSALEEYQKALSVKPSKEIKGKIENIQMMIKNAESISISNAENFILKSDLLNAVREWRKALKVNSGNKDVSEKLAKYKDEIKALKEKIYLEGLDSYGNEDYEKAISKWREVIVLEPECEKALLNITKAERKLNKAVNVIE